MESVVATDREAGFRAKVPVREEKEQGADLIRMPKEEYPRCQEQVARGQVQMALQRWQASRCRVERRR